MQNKTLKLCFRDRDWEWLQQQPIFRAASRAIKTFEDVERVSRFGARLIQVARDRQPRRLADST